MWWPLARDTSTLRLGFREFDFALCRAGKWDDAKEAFKATGLRTRMSDVTRAVNQVRDFFELPTTDRVTVWHRYEIAKQAIRAGLVDWLLLRTT
jgi:hypothetical protein